MRWTGLNLVNQSAINSKQLNMPLSSLQSLKNSKLITMNSKNGFESGKRKFKKKRSKKRPVIKWDWEGRGFWKVKNKNLKKKLKLPNQVLTGLIKVLLTLFRCGRSSKNLICFSQD
jgi:hypothetical protein